MQSITTKYLHDTATKGGRIKATASGGRSLIVSDGALLDFADAEAKHTEVARRLAESLKWRGHWHSGGTRDGKGYHFCCEPVFIIA